ncbi:MAG: Gfo/Idh/MocA family oxidoreductase [Acidobacteriaceae bacterium]
MVRYGILGFGNHGVKRLLPAFAGAQESVLTGIWRRDLQKAHSQASEFGIEHVFSSAEGLCASPSIDAVFVSSPDALHMDDTLLAISCGKPVLCEKPAAMSAAQLHRMIDAARKANVAFGIAQNFRYNRSVNVIREWLRQGRVGAPIFAAAQFAFLAEQSPRKWIYDRALACGGAIGDVGIHCIDALRYVLGDNVSTVTAVADPNSQSTGIETTAAIAVEFAQGTLGSVLASFRAKYHTWMEIVGEDGVIQSDDCFTLDHPVQVILRKDGEIVEVQQVVNDEAYSLMIDSFSAWIENRGIYAAPGEDAIHNQLTLDAAYASMRSGMKQAVSLT